MCNTYTICNYSRSNTSSAIWTVVIINNGRAIDLVPVVGSGTTGKIFIYIMIQGKVTIKYSKSPLPFAPSSTLLFTFC